MPASKPSLSDQFWAFLHKNDSFGESCFQLRVAAANGDLWRTDYLIDRLRGSGDPSAELEIGYAMQKAAVNGRNAVVALMFEKDCGLVPYKQPRQEQRRFCNAAQAAAYQNSAAARHDQKELAKLEKLDWREISFLYAVTHDRTATAKLFLDSGIDAALDNNRALLLATGKDFREMTALLLAHGADPAANYYEPLYNGIYHDSSRMFGDSCLDPLLAQNIAVPKEHMEALIAAALKEDNFHSPSLEKVLNFALRQPEKADTKPLFSLPALQWNDVARNMLEEYQSLADKTKTRKPPRTRKPQV